MILKGKYSFNFNFKLKFIFFLSKKLRINLNVPLKSVEQKDIEGVTSNNR